MRVDEQVFKSVAFIGRVLHDDGTTFDGEPLGTGFFVSMNASIKGKMFHYFVTAKHVIDGLAGERPYMVINRVGGGRKMLKFADNFRWWTHPDNTTTAIKADVAVFPFNVRPDHDIVSIGVEDAFLTDGNWGKYRIGVGDEVFITGLFTYASGESRNMPIIRHGNIAMIPDGPIETNSDGFIDAYLIEARSIGGLSGSPVFARETLFVAVKDSEGEKVAMGGVGRMQFMGLCLGHWDIDPSQKNKAWFTPPTQGVNMGIGIVVPAIKIIETLNLPELVAMRQKIEVDERNKLPDVVKDSAEKSHERFQALAGKVLSVPKEAIDRREQAFKHARADRPKVGRKPKR